MKALITGATGLIGRALAQELDALLVLSRSPERAKNQLEKETKGSVEAYPWRPEEGPPPLEAFEGVDVVFHFAGEPIAEGRWTKAKKARIRESRVLGTKHLVDALSSLSTPPKTLISASAVGIYGDRGDELLEEASPYGEDFLAGVCLGWEAEALRAEKLGVRVVNPRLGVVLASGGGALQKMLPPFKLGLGGPLAGGKQWMPWVHLEDVIGVLLFAARTPSVRGPINLVSPTPVTNRDFTKALAGALGRPAFLPAPKLGLRLALGEVASVLTASQRALPKAATELGYSFRYPELAKALERCLEKSPE